MGGEVLLLGNNSSFTDGPVDVAIWYAGLLRIKMSFFEAFNAHALT